MKIAINGFGRIGRSVFRALLDSPLDLELAAINDLTDKETLRHLLKYDSLYGHYPKEVIIDNDGFLVQGKKIRVFAESQPENLPWEKMGVEIVLECTGRFRDKKGASKHLEAGAKKVVISAPAKDDDIPSFVLGVNEGKYDPQKDHICDMGSCTTNCLAPIVKVLHQNLKIKSGLMTTIHSYTNDQQLLDLAHKDLRRARAAAVNIIPTTTGAAKAIGKVIPELNNKLNGIAMRVPTPTVSVVDLMCQVEKTLPTEKINDLFRQSAQGDLRNILMVSEEPLVSADFKGNSFSAIVDAQLTQTMGEMVKVVAWYDNEWAYSLRLVEFAGYIANKN